MAKRRRVKGEGTIVKRKDGRFESKISLGIVNGKRIRKTVYGKSQAEALKKKRELEARAGRNVPDGRLSEYLEQWLRDGKSRWEPQTYRTYLAWLRNHVLPYFGSRRIASLTSQDIRVWLRQLEDNDVGPVTRKRSLSTLKSALKQLVDEELLPRNPCNPVKPPVVRRREFYVPKPDEIKVLLHVAQPYWFFVLVLVAFTCAMREGEIFALYWSQVDLKEGSVLVDRSLGEDWNGKPIRKEPKNKYSRRVLYVPPVTVAALRKLKEEQVNAGYLGPWVFRDEEGGPLRKSNFIRRLWKPLIDTAGLPYFKFHAARHASNSILIAQGENPLAIARRMGHADTRMTFDTYGHFFENGAVAASKVGRALDEAGVNVEAFGLGEPLKTRPATAQDNKRQLPSSKPVSRPSQGRRR